MYYYYVDTQELESEPYEGEQYVAWIHTRSHNNPSGVPYITTVKGEHCELRAFDEDTLNDYLRATFPYSPYIRTRTLIEEGAA